MSQATILDTLIEIDNKTGGNGAASATGAAVPSQAGYTGYNSAGNLVGVSTANPLPVAQQGTATISGTVTANAGSGTMAVSATSLPLPSGAATSAKQPALGSAGTPSADVLSVQGTTSMTPLKVDGSGATQPISGTVTVQQSTASSLKVDLSGTAANATAIKVDGSAVTQPVSGTVTAAQATAASLNATIVGTKTNNNAAPGASNIGSLPVLANAAPPTWTEGDQVTHSADLAGNLRAYCHPANALGYYQWTGNVAYAGVSANGPLFSMRWGDATRLAVILKVEIAVMTTTTASAASVTERQLIIARGFTASDTGGTAVTLTGNNQKRRTSMGTSLVTDMRIGGPLTAGTRTLDAAPVSSVIGWSGLLSTGVVIGASGSSAVGAARSTEGGIQPAKLLDATNGQDHPIILAQNEGIVVRIGLVQPTGSTQQSFITVTWAEVNAF